METLLAAARAIVLVGTVVFAFAAIVFGFVIVMREYKLLSTFDQLERFIALTNDSNLQADAAKGTVTLGRARPGIILIMIGAVVLIVCIFKPFEYESTREEGTAPTVHRASITSSQAATTPDVSASINNDATIQKGQGKQVEPGKKENGGEQVRDDGSPSKLRLLDRPKPSLGATRDEKKEEPKPSLSNGLTVESITALRFQLLDKWLSSVENLTGKSLEDQRATLVNKFGDAYIALERVIQDQPSSFDDLASVAYDNSKYAPLLRVFNPKLADKEPVPAFTNVIYLVPLGLNNRSHFSKTKTTLRIAGASKEDIYASVLNQIEKIMSLDEYRKDPADFWRRSGRSVFDFLDFYNKDNIRSASLQPYETEVGDTFELIARIKYGSAKYHKLIGFFNPDKAAILSESKKPIPVGTRLLIFTLIEF